MSQFMQMHGLMPMLPEIVLALGVMVLLMVGVTAGERIARGRSTGWRSSCSPWSRFSW